MDELGDALTWLDTVPSNSDYRGAFEFDLQDKRLKVSFKSFSGDKSDCWIFELIEENPDA